MKRLTFAILAVFCATASLWSDVLSIPPATPAALNAASNALVPMHEAIVGISKPTFAAGNNTIGSAASWRTKWIIANNCRGIYLHYIGAYTVGGSFNNAYIATTLKAAIQLADASGNPIGRNFPVTFTAPASAPSLTGTIAIPAYDLKSDFIPIPFTAGQIVFVVTYAPTTTSPVNSFLSNDTGESFYQGDATTTTPPSYNTTQQGAVACGPACITANIPVTQMHGVMLMGDSISQLSNMDYSTITNGWLQKGLLATGGGTLIPVVNTAIGGSRLIGQTNAVEYYLCYYPLLNGWVRSVVTASGFNDFFSDGATAASVEQAALWTWSTLRSIGASNIVACTVKPGTTSTDGYLTVVNQTPRSGDTDRLLFNTWLTNQVNVAGGVDGLFDLGASLCSPTNISRLATGPLTVLLSDTAGSGTSTAAVFCSAAGVGTISVSGGEMALTHSGTTYYTQIKSFRPGSTNAMLPSFNLTAAAAGDSYVVYQAWEGDVSSLAHPSGYGYAQIASQWPSNLTAILLR